MELPINYNEAHYTVRREARNAYVELQDGKCCHCGADLTGKPDEQIRQMPVDKRLFPPNFFKWPIHLHHDHVTGMTIGAVHNYCNAVLWQYHGE